MSDVIVMADPRVAAVPVRYRRSLRALRPDLGDDELRAATSRCVSPPEVVPHPTGAAVDLTLCDGHGAQLDLGCAYDATPEQSDGACSTAAPGVTGTAADDRQLLVHALTAAGLVNYPCEWWHWSYGDRYWALKTEAPAALYGPQDLRARARAGAV